jgi:ABC-type methionine transport system ATPase subunit
LDLLDQVELASYAHRLPSALSGGQQQRVAIARALANDPPILVADEPTGNLDSSTATSVINLFSKLVRQGKTIVMVTHDQDLVRHVVRTIFLKDGRVTGDNVTTADKEGLQATPQLTVESLDRTKIDEETGSDNQNSNPMPGSIADTIADILADPNNAAGKLREILDETPGDREERETLYQLIYEQVKNKADQAEQIGDLEAARKYWSILIDLTRK